MLDLRPKDLIATKTTLLLYLRFGAEEIKSWGFYSIGVQILSAVDVGGPGESVRLPPPPRRLYQPSIGPSPTHFLFFYSCSTVPLQNRMNGLVNFAPPTVLKLLLQEPTSSSVQELEEHSMRQPRYLYHLRKNASISLGWQHRESGSSPSPWTMNPTSATEDGVQNAGRK